MVRIAKLGIQRRPPRCHADLVQIASTFHLSDPGRPVSGMVVIVERLGTAGRCAGVWGGGRCNRRRCRSRSFRRADGEGFAAVTAEGHGAGVTARGGCEHSSQADGSARNTASDRRLTQSGSPRRTTAPSRQPRCSEEPQRNGSTCLTQ